MSLYDDISTEDFGGWSLGAVKPATPAKPEHKKAPATTPSEATPPAPVVIPKVDPAIAKERSQMAAMATAVALKRAAAAESAAKSRTMPSLASSSVAVPDIRKVADSSDLPLRFNALTGKLERGPPVLSASSPFQTDFSISFTGVQDEYDPAKPNEYDDVIRKREREKVRQAAERASERDKRDERGGGSGGMELSGRRRRHSGDRSSDEEENQNRRSSQPMKGAAIAPPKALLEDDAKPKGDSGPLNPMTSPGLTVGAVLGLSSQSSASPSGGGGGSASIASRIMAKMGYKAGQGLGRQEQGMSRALQVEKTSLRGGRIIHEKDAPILIPETMPTSDGGTMGPPAALLAAAEAINAALPAGAASSPSPVMSTAELLKHPSKVIVLRNMVGHGEVDEVLEGEVTEECLKYGKVAKCMIFELPNAIDEEAVRIFVEFERQESAIKALIDLNGRFFGGRTVRANFYSLEKFRSFDLGDILS